VDSTTTGPQLPVQYIHPALYNQPHFLLWSSNDRICFSGPYKQQFVFSYVIIGTQLRIPVAWTTHSSCSKPFFLFFTRNGHSATTGSQLLELFFYSHWALYHYCVTVAWTLFCLAFRDSATKFFTRIGHCRTTGSHLAGLFFFPTLSTIPMSQLVFLHRQWALSHNRLFFTRIGHSTSTGSQLYGFIFGGNGHSMTTVEGFHSHWTG
jgi:hypothetical protein